MANEKNNEAYNNAEDFEYVDKKKEALGCLGAIGEEALGCVFQIVVCGVIMAIIMLLVKACN